MTRSILLIEDETRFAKIMALELQEAGYHVTIASDGPTGLKQAKETAPDLLLLDWSLPGLTGPDLCRQLRKADQDTPVIFVTSYAEEEGKRVAMAAGANDYLMKPFDINALLDKIRTFLAQTMVPVALDWDHHVMTSHG